MKEPKANVWRITGYKGRNDYDGSEDDNIKVDVVFDSRLKKEDVEEMMCQYWSRWYRNVESKANILAENMPIAEINEILGEK